MHNSLSFKSSSLFEGQRKQKLIINPIAMKVKLAAQLLGEHFEGARQQPRDESQS